MSANLQHNRCIGPFVQPAGQVPNVAFAAGSYLGLRITTLRSKESGPWPPAMTVLLTLVAIAESASLAVWLATTGHPPTAGCDVLIALYSLAMGIQTAAVRSLGVQGVFTTAGTFTLVALTGTFAGSRSKAEIPRLTGVFVGLVAGAVGGGLLLLHARSYAPLLPLVITVLVIASGRLMARRTSGVLIATAYQLVDNRSWTGRCTKRNVEGEGAQP